MSSLYSYLEWVLSHWTHFTVRRFVYVYMCVYYAFLFYTAYVLYYCEHGAGIKALSLGLHLSLLL